MFYTLNLAIYFSISDNLQILWKVDSFNALTKVKCEGLKRNGCLKTDEGIAFL